MLLLASYITWVVVGADSTTEHGGGGQAVQAVVAKALLGVPTPVELSTRLARLPSAS